VLGGELRERDVLNGQLPGQFQAQADGGQSRRFGFEMAGAIGAIGDRQENVVAFGVGSGGGVVARRGFQFDGGPGQRVALRIEDSARNAAAGEGRGGNRECEDE
jgi:hypothetical protein